jgi:hypothetical protein
MRHRKLWYIAVLSALPITVLAGWLVGEAATSAHKPFDWIAATAAATAAGTVSLALVTGVLAVMTAREVQITSEIEAARIRPVLVIAKLHNGSWDIRPGSRTRRKNIAVSIANVGAGPALAVHVTAMHPDELIDAEQVEVLAYIGPSDDPQLTQLRVTQRLPESTPETTPANQAFGKDIEPSEFTYEVACIDRLRKDVPDVLVKTS